jgi:hypothetical protein
MSLDLSGFVTFTGGSWLSRMKSVKVTPCWKRLSQVSVQQFQSCSWVHSHMRFSVACRIAFNFLTHTHTPNCLPIPSNCCTKNACYSKIYYTSPLYGRIVSGASVDPTLQALSPAMLLSRFWGWSQWHFHPNASSGFRVEPYGITDRQTWSALYGFTLCKDHIITAPLKKWLFRGLYKGRWVSVWSAFLYITDIFNALRIQDFSDVTKEEEIYICLQ